MITKQDIIKIRDTCKQDILNHKPPPRSFIKGNINLKHFIYHIESLKQQLQNNQLNEQNQNRKLKQRELQLEELRKRIQRIKSDHSKLLQSTNLQHQQDIKTQQLKIQNLTRINNEIKNKNEQYSIQIKKLNDIISTLENEQSQRSSTKEPSLDPAHDIFVEESPSESSIPNSEDIDFIVDDDHQDSSGTYEQLTENNESDVSDDEESLDMIIL